MTKQKKDSLTLQRSHLKLPGQQTKKEKERTKSRNLVLPMEHHHQMNNCTNHGNFLSG
jgi:hypothetical protein